MSLLQCISLVLSLQVYCVPGVHGNTTRVQWVFFERLQVQRIVFGVKLTVTQIRLEEADQTRRVILITVSVTT